MGLIHSSLLQKWTQFSVSFIKDQCDKNLGATKLWLTLMWIICFMLWRRGCFVFWTLCVGCLQKAPGFSFSFALVGVGCFSFLLPPPFPPLPPPLLFNQATGDTFYHSWFYFILDTLYPSNAFLSKIVSELGKSLWQPFPYLSNLRWINWHLKFEPVIFGMYRLKPYS